MNNNKVISICEMIRCWSRETPGKTALRSIDGEKKTYVELVEFFEYANELLDNYVSPGSRLALIMDQGYLSSLLTLSVTDKHSVLPLNPAHSQSEFEDFFKRYKVDVVLCDGNYRKAVLAAARKEKVGILKLKLKNNTLTIHGRLNGKIKKLNSNKGQKGSIVLPTSGTTSKPKIVILSKRNIYYSAKNICHALKLSKNDVCLNLMPLFHVHGLMVLVSSLFIGSRTICSPKYSNFEFPDWLYGFKPTWYTASAGIQENILQYANKAKISYKDLKIRFIRSSSAPLSKETTTKIEELFNAPILESYGMTEAALQITSQPAPPEKKKLGSCGKAAGLELAILDDDNNFLENGKTGEIVIRGKNVITEYEDDPKENKTSFWQGWLKTGDWGLIDEDGFVYISGRIKELINKGGEKISPREIDEAILKHPAVKEAATFSMPHSTLGEDVATGVVLEDGRHVSENDLKKFLRDKLADFKVPTRIVFVKQFPKTPVGKIKRVGLYEIFKPYFKKNKKTPASDLEKIICGIWSDLLGVPDHKIKVDDNFYEIGGDSLRLKDFLSIMKKKGYNVKEADVLNNPTIKDLSSLIYDKK